MLQNGITNLASLLDNVMVGQLGTESMSGVAIANQLLNVFYVSLFGVVSGASIFGAQFVGQKNIKGLQDTFRFRLLMGFLLVDVFIIVFLLADNPLISLFLTDNGTGNIALALSEGEEYLRIMLGGMIPYVIIQIYASTHRDMGRTVVAMAAGFVSVGVNLCLNYLLIFGNFGFPELGVKGAAIGTVSARLVEMVIVVLWTHTHKKVYVFAQGLYRTLKVPFILAKQILKKGIPLFLNEFLWSSGMAVLAQSYSLRGLDVVAAYNISSTVTNLFSVALIALGSAIGIIVGQKLGAGEIEEAVDTDRKLIAFSVAICMVIGAVLFFLAPVFPGFYNTDGSVKELATGFLRIAAVFIPVHAFYNATYFTLRSGGKTFITFLFDACSLWCVSVVCATLLVHFTALPALCIYLIISCIDILKLIAGLILVNKRVWVNNMVENI